MSEVPVNIQLAGDETLRIEWSDGRVLDYAVTELRRSCPCATCREKRRATPEPGGLPVLSAEEAQPTRIQGMKPVGNYAYAIHFNDGHDTGIFSFELLREIGHERK